MKHMLQICCKNNNIYKEFPIGSSLLDIYYGFNLNFPYQVVSAKVNNKVESLDFRVYYNKDIEFLDITSPSGMRTYVRSLCFILVKAVEELYPTGSISLEHPVSKGYFCDLHIGRPVKLEDVSAIKQRMQELIAEDIPFQRIECHTEKVVHLFRERGMTDKAQLLETSGQLYSYYNRLGDTVDYYYGSLVPSTGYIRLFDIVKYYDGLLLRIPNRQNPDHLEDVVKQEKMLEVFQEYHHWNQIMGLSTVGDFNTACNDGHATDLINLSEALQEKKIARIADEITNRGENGERVKLVLISGPSSSGKTTFSKRLSIQLMTNGLKPYPISLDDYFVNREDTPLDENGQQVISKYGKPMFRKSYSVLQDNLFAHMTEAGFVGFERGVLGSTAENLSSLDYQIQKDKERLAHIQERIEAEQVRYEPAHEVRKTMAEIEGMGQKTLTGKIAVSKDDYQQLTALAKEGITSRSEIQDLKSSVSYYQRQYFNASSAVERLQERYDRLKEKCQSFLQALEHFPKLVEVFVEKVKELFSIKEAQERKEREDRAAARKEQSKHRRGRNDWER